MKYANYFIAIFAMTVLLFACERGTSNTNTQDIQIQNPQSENLLKDEDGTDKDKQVPTPNSSKSITQKTPAIKNDNINWDKKIIKTADIQLQLDDYKKFNTSIHSSLKNYGAYIAGEKEIQNDFKIENSLTIKVPAANFEDLINGLQGDGIKVTEKNILSDDVTGEMVDTKARMLAKTQVRDKYLQLLKQAKNMNEILQVQTEINNIQEDIEAANGRVNYLQHSSAYSTINLNFFQYVNGTTANDEKPDFFTKLSKAFSIGTSVITNIILFCISIWPLLLIGVAFLLYAKNNKAKKLRAAKNVI